MQPLKLSVLDLAPVYDSATDEIALQQAGQLAAAAEREGYHRYWAAEHHGMPMLASSAPEILLAYIGAQTSRIRLGTGALLLPHYKPLKVVEMFHMLACLFPGRIDMGLGRAPGGSGPVSLSLSDNFIANIAKLPETLESVIQLLDGTYTKEGESVIARPTPPIRPELWMLGTNKKSAAFAAAHGTGYVFGQFMSDADGAEVLRDYRAAFQPVQERSEPQTMVAIGVICAPTAEEAQTLADEAASQLPVKPDEAGAPLLQRRQLVGEPAEVLRQLAELSACYRTDEFLIQCAIPDYAKRLRSYELLARMNQSAG